MLNGTASKFLIAIAGALTTLLTTYYGTAKWEPVVITLISAALVYLIPNTGKPAPAGKLTGARVSWPAQPPDTAEQPTVKTGRV